MLPVKVERDTVTDPPLPQPSPLSIAPPVGGGVAGERGRGIRGYQSIHYGATTDLPAYTTNSAARSRRSASSRTRR